VEKEGKSQEKPDLRHDPPIGFSSRGTRDRPCEMAFHLSASPFLGERGGREASTSVSSRHREIPLDCLSKSISSLRFRLLVESGLFSPRNFQTELSSRSCNLDLVE